MYASWKKIFFFKYTFYALLAKLLPDFTLWGNNVAQTSQHFE